MLKIRMKTRWEEEEKDVENLVSNFLSDYDGYSGGKIEHIEQKQNNIISAFGKLLEVLAKEKKLTARQIVKICTYLADDSKVEFIETEDVEDED